MEPRVLQVLRAPVGGLFRHVADLTRGLVDQRVAVGLVMDSADAGPRWESVIDELAEIAPLGVTRIEMSRGLGPRDLLAVAHVYGRIRRDKVTVVHGHGAKGGAFARIAGTLARRDGHPARVYTPHGGTLHFAPQSREGQIYRGLERLLARATETTLFESAFARSGFAALLGRDEPAWPVVFNGLDRQEFESVALNPDAADIVFIGELRHLKGVDVLLDALALCPETTAVFVGAGPDESEYRERAMKLDLAKRAQFFPPMPARDAFALGRVVVAPSRAESLPYIVLEAIAAGRPVITTRVGGIPEIFADADDQLLPPGDVSALAGMIRAAHADPHGMRTRADMLRTSVMERFSLDRMVDAILTQYREALARSGTATA